MNINKNFVLVIGVFLGALLSGCATTGAYSAGGGVSINGAYVNVGSDLAITNPTCAKIMKDEPAITGTYHAVLCQSGSNAEQAYAATEVNRVIAQTAYSWRNLAYERTNRVGGQTIFFDCHQPAPLGPPDRLSLGYCIEGREDALANKIPWQIRTETQNSVNKYRAMGAGSAPR
ncbi:MAG: hypothetical protein Q7S34_02420 [bacterium]|nr:hypothetical protein [bacterium]